MLTLSRRLISALAATAFAVGGLLLLAGPGEAKDEPSSKPKLDCSKQQNKRRPECRSSGRLDDNELFYAGYWLTRRGEYSDALTYLRQIRNADEARVQTYIGYALRKLGHWEDAVAHYNRALTLNPDFISARAYLGEALLERGDVSSAREQLARIDRLCGGVCLEATELSAAIREHEQRRG